MGLSRSARRGIGLFSEIQTGPKRFKYLVSVIGELHAEALLENARRDLLAVKVGGF